MEKIGETYSAIRKAVKEKKDESVIKEHIKTLITEFEAADELHYLKDEEKEEEMSALFRLSAGLKLPRLVKATWDESTYVDNKMELKFNCATCHSAHREN